jgi:hypothetical protein
LRLNEQKQTVSSQHFVGFGQHSGAGGYLGLPEDRSPQMK